MTGEHRDCTATGINGALTAAGAHVLSESTVSTVVRRYVQRQGHTKVLASRVLDRLADGHLDDFQRRVAALGGEQVQQRLAQLVLDDLG